MIRLHEVPSKTPQQWKPQKRTKWFLNPVNLVVDVTLVTIPIIGVLLITSASPHTVDSNDFEVNDAQQKSSVTHYQCQMCPRKRSLVLVGPQRPPKPLTKYEICYECKSAIKNVFRIENTRIKNTPRGIKNSRDTKTEKALFLAVGLFQTRPAFHGFCLSVHHQLCGTGHLCGKAH